MSKLRLYLIGIMMGIADLIPGISGGTVAFISGIYEELLISIKSLQFHSLRKIAWPFLLPLGGGILTAIFLCARVLLFLIVHFQAPLFALFFGLIAGSAWLCIRKTKLNKSYHFISLLVGAAISVTLSIFTFDLLFGATFFGILLAGILGGCAMLLPGISGSFLLQVLGVYPLVLYALSFPTAPGAFKVLLAMGIGVSLGFVLFSKILTFLLTSCRQVTVALLVGFMAGGLKALWPFGEGNLLLNLFLAFMGFLVAILLEIRTKKLKIKNEVPSSV